MTKRHLNEDGLYTQYEENQDGTLSEVVAARPQFSGLALSGSARVSQHTTLFDGRIYGSENTLKWDTKGTGTATYSENSIIMSVTAGQYLVRQSKVFCNYFSGKPQEIEATSINFKAQAGVVKRVGYFSSNTVAPYASNYDGMFLESYMVGAVENYDFVIMRDGVEKSRISWRDFKNQDHLLGIDWAGFNAFDFDFLWLGGIAARLSLANKGEFSCVHKINHAGTGAAQTITLNPNQPVRYEIRSTTGSGYMTSVCSQVGTEGAGNETGEALDIAGISVSANSVGTIYALLAVRKSSQFRHCSVIIDTVGGAISGATKDAGVLYLMSGAVWSSAPTFSPLSKVEAATATNQTIISNGRIIAAIPIVSEAQIIQGAKNALRELAVDIDGVATEITLAYSPLTNSQSVIGFIGLIEY